jgi:Phosphoribosylanthranilate isomerase
MLVQLYSLTHPADVRALVEFGVDRIGVATGQQGLPAEVSLSRARELFSLVPDDHTTVALSVHETVERAAAFARRLQPDVLHRCPPAGTDNPDHHRRLADRLSDGTRLMKAIAVGTDEAAIDRAMAFAPASDSLLLDSASPDIPGVGATGETHNWSISRRIVEQVDLPVILAGGLGLDNVTEAIHTVGPSGVDSYTKTSRTERRKDLDRSQAFVQAARNA